MKRTLAFLLVSCLAVLALASCSRTYKDAESMLADRRYSFCPANNGGFAVFLRDGVYYDNYAKTSNDLNGVKEMLAAFELRRIDDTVYLNKSAADDCDYIISQEKGDTSLSLKYSLWGSEKDPSILVVMPYIETKTGDPAIPFAFILVKRNGAD